eukprot:TRINITY_DN2582_c0_g1_i4.p1 TRINITY_DN2582_c0_g1~~TRINITY_DN2582_c0_g1_i4.p1  ORF type:complete len:123 (-),score=20.98 TRINITY_DN2582_c0_g1_i4:15-383(-)
MDDDIQKFNSAQLQEISGEDLEFEKELIDLYKGEFEAALERIKTALEEGNEKEFILYSHDLKGSSANVGADAISAICKTMEKLGKDGKMMEGDKYVPYLEAEYEAFVEVFDQYCLEREDSQE